MRRLPCVGVNAVAPIDDAHGDDGASDALSETGTEAVMPAFLFWTSLSMPMARGPHKNRPDVTGRWGEAQIVCAGHMARGPCGWLLDVEDAVEARLLEDLPHIGVDARELDALRGLAHDHEDAKARRGDVGQVLAVDAHPFDGKPR